MSTQATQADSPADADLIAAFTGLRPHYQGEIARGLDRFFGPRRDTCPWCSSPALRTILRTGDRTQRKPGTFVLDRCALCRHVFQNPMLNPEGLDFYYRDFYDGIGRATIEPVFDARGEVYRTRARQLAPFYSDGAGPTSWLDIGAGYGHFCRDAAGVWPDTTFDGLDQGEGVVDAAAKGWLGTAHRGSFPDLAAGLSGRYDVISMFHYLEHVLDIRAELDLVAATLPPGGLLQVEVPNPESWLRVLRGLWVQWFQPQHLHFAPLGNLLAALTERRLRPVSVQLAPAHIPVDVTCALMAALVCASPDPRLPWRSDEPGRVYGRRHQLVWTRACPRLLPSAYRADALIARLVRHLPSQANLYRVLARKE